ncbi:hypothetical protein H4R20_003403 [Coemansia guatemalensis]|uniref:AB hydrolase-1 domain-containing protein n=1 Tax=Coemansia guatemalensis TaxID=2761395 RepID=A0A9W8HTD3_9FUNG|nr:hypothetical protein H4R20_003403 [Coemansia guatemalensis]
MPTQATVTNVPAWGVTKSAPSLFRLWPWPADTKSNHQIELELLAESGLQVVSSSNETLATSTVADTKAELMDVDIDDSGNYIHTLAIRGGDGDGATKRHSLVLTHGYFTGLGFFFRNMHELSRVPGWDVYAIDWLGMGRSSRPPYKSQRGESEDARVAHAENFFVESLEEWRQRMGIERMTLCGHSFGGYMSALYALRYPDRVEKLVLASPIGVPAQPADFEERLREGRGPARRRLPAKGEATTPEYEDAAAAEPEQPSRSRMLMFRVLMGLWERNYAPQWLVRSTGPFSRRLIDWYVGRFIWLNDTQRQALAAYTHQITVLPGSSEAALGDILRPGAFARRPLVDRLGPIAMPTVFMYGANDWVDHSGGAQAIRRIAAAGSVATSLFRVPNTGHNLHLENPIDFNRILASEMRATSEKR